MRKIIVSEFVSLDGIMEGPGPDDSFKYAGWTMPYVDDEFITFKHDELFSCDTLLLGRVTYEGFAKAWPKRQDDQGFAARMNSIPKYVVSTSLDEITWSNTHLIKDDIVRQLRALKEDPGQDILVAGSGVLIELLMHHNLIDEYRLLVYPVILGEGKHLFKEGVRATLELINTDTFETGVVLMRYRPAKV